jgi:putative holliday junction resolvase
MNSSKTVLSFDYGTKSIGVAVGNDLTGSASLLPALKAQDGIPDWQQIAKLIADWQPQLLLVGLPLNMDGRSRTLPAAPVNLLTGCMAGLACR